MATEPRTIVPTGSLLDRCRAGHTGAWSELVATYERLVYSIALRSGLSQQDAGDVAQITFATLVENLDKIDKDDSVGWWLATVARRTTYRMIERRRREVADEFAGADETTGASDDEVVDALALHEGLARLEASCRQLLTALFAEEATYVDIARRMGHQIGSIGPMRARCLAHLKKILQANNVVTP